jgi:hypothetical protein
MGWVFPFLFCCAACGRLETVEATKQQLEALGYVE